MSTSTETAAPAETYPRRPEACAHLRHEFLDGRGARCLDCGTSFPRITRMLIGSAPSAASKPAS